MSLGLSIFNWRGAVLLEKVAVGSRLFQSAGGRGGAGGGEGGSSNQVIVHPSSSSKVIIASELRGKWSGLDPERELSEGE